MKENVNLSDISNDLEIPEHIIQINIVELILSDLILCSFEVISGRIKKFEINVKIKHFLINFHKRALMVLQSPMFQNYYNCKKMILIRSQFLKPSQIE